MLDPTNRIRLSEALEMLEPLMSKATFYGSKDNPGPRRTLVRRLDIRKGPPITLDRTAFLAWLHELIGEHAHEMDPRAERLKGRE